MNSTVLSTSGAIYKKEIVRSLKIRSVSDRLILESADPFPDVHHKYKSLLPKYFYIAIDSCYLDHDVIHLAKFAERSLNEDLEAAVGNITYDDKKFTVLRLKDLRPKLLAQAIQAYNEYGVKFNSFDSNINGEAFIHVRKFFYLEEIEKGFYFDLDENEKGYLEIPRRFDWEEFQKITQQVKEDCKYENFDSAFGVITKYGVSQDVVRIYCPEMDEDKLMTIGKGFLKHLFL